MRDNDRLVRRVDAGMRALRAALARAPLLGDLDRGPDDVLRAADAAMYAAKHRGGGRYHLQAVGSGSRAAGA